MKKATLAPLSTGVLDKKKTCFDAALHATVFQVNRMDFVTSISASNRP